MAIEVGTKAPDFTLKSKNAEGLQDITLSDNFKNGKTVLLFFPFVFSGICDTEMCSVRDSLADFNDLGGNVFGISVDSPFALKAFSDHYNLNFPLLSDFGKQVSTEYDVLYEDFIGYHGVAKRSAFVIDENGIITLSLSSDDPTIIPDFDAIKAALN
jgi:peroxiredoxin